MGQEMSQPLEAQPVHFVTFAVVLWRSSEIHHEFLCLGRAFALVIPCCLLRGYFHSEEN